MNKRNTVGNASTIVNGKPQNASVKQRKVIVFFIGGAGDKKHFYTESGENNSWLERGVASTNASGPNYNMEDVVGAFENDNYIKNEIKNGAIIFNEKPGKHHANCAEYLKFDDIFGSSNIKKNVTSVTPSKQTFIYIIGHSLGGWNGAHLSSILSAQGYTVDLLITIDPVGENYNSWLLNDVPLYKSYPSLVANYWINLRYDGNTKLSSDSSGFMKRTMENLEYWVDTPDMIANIGGRWNINQQSGSHPRKADVYQIVSVNHASTMQSLLIGLKMANGKTAWQILIDRIGKAING